MNLNKVTYVDDVTVIYAQNMNDIQDAIIELEDDTANAIIDTVSGDIANFYGTGSAVSSLTTTIEPIQDMNGYDHPWAGGAGKNLIPYPYLETTRTVNGLTFTDNGDGTITVNGTATALTIFQIKGRSSGNTLGLEVGTRYTISGCPSGGSGSTYKVDILKYSGTAYVADYGNGASFTYSEATADDVVGQIRIVIYTGTTLSNLVFKPMIRLASVTDSTWEPYENVCPIRGRSAVKVNRTNKNLIPYPYYETTKTVNGITFTDLGDGSVRVNGTNTGTSTAECILVAQGQSITLPSGNYIINGCTGGSTSTYLIQWNPGGGTVVNATDGDKSLTLNNDSPMRITIKVMSGATVNNVVIKPMIRLASDTDDTWESPVDNETTSISLGRTVYGGTLNVTTGELTVDRQIVDMGTLSWGLNSSTTTEGYSIFYVTNLPRKFGKQATSPILADCFERYMGSSGYTYMPDHNIQGNSSSATVYVSDSRYTTASDFKTGVSGHNMVYMLATPVTYSLSGTEITTLLGENNIWTDCGEVEVIYKADTKAYIDQKIAELQALILEA